MEKLIEESNVSGDFISLEKNILRIRSNKNNSFERYAKIPFMEKLDSNIFECYIIEDESCLPDYNINDFIIFQNTLPEKIKNGQFVVIKYENNYLLRKYYMEEDKIIYKAINQSFPVIIHGINQKSILVGVSYYGYNSIKHNV